MNNGNSVISKINEELAIAGQIALNQLRHVAREGYQTVLNLRSPHEDGFLESEQFLAELLGLRYIHIPTQFQAFDLNLVRQILEHIAELPKPILLHCDSGIRSAAIAFMHVTVQQGAPLEQAFEQAIKNFLE
jgi:uncharacterized protein (TIGR01244 family)